MRKHQDELIKECERLYDTNQRLERALDRACEELASLSYKINMMENPMAYDAEYMKEEEWKEWCMEE